MSNILRKTHLNYCHFVVVVLFFLVDQISKFIIVRALPLHHSVKVLPFLHFTYVANTGTVWGLLQGKNFMFIIIMIVVIFFIVFFLWKQVDNTFALLLILSGAIGNLFDRVFRGKVIDFIDVGFWPVFNLADSYVTIGIALIFLQNIFKVKKYKKFT